MKSLGSSSQNYSYDVFLSFRGEDTRKTFTDHLYKALRDEGLIIFRDDEEIERGEEIEFEIEKGIQQSRCWVIVFSKDYAGSSWCLDELVMIFQSRNKSKRLLLPVFYHVDPSDIRKQSGSIFEAFYMHEQKLNKEMDDTKRKDLINKIKRWRTALTDLANLGGMPLQNTANGYESKFIQKIVNVVKDKVAFNIVSMTPHPVGIDTSVHVINSWLRNHSNEVEVLALYGIGGVGKTTIAKYVYNMNLQLFEGGSFLENIREYSERSDGLVNLQRQLLSDISKGNTSTINTLNDGILKIQIALRHRKKLMIVLDDVDQVEQLNTIFGMRDWFFQGSKIIITTRNVHLLKAYEHCTRYAVKKLNYNDSLDLFSWHAFRDSRPLECYKEHSEKIIKQCQGLPLALEVLGSSLRGKKVDVWRSAIEKLEIIPDCKIQKILKISYDSLQDDHDRELFLEIACFFNGEARSYLVGILDECNFYTAIGIDNLIDRCMLKIDKYEKIKMHHSIQSMGREIIRQQSPKDPGKRSRLWHYKDSLEVLTDETGTRALEGLALDMNKTSAQKAEFRTEAFAMMQKLRLLKINNLWLRGSYKDFPKKLKWLCWHGYPSRSLPNDFPISSLVAIDMQSSKLQKLGQDNMILGSLKFLNLSHCHDIVKTPDFTKLFALEQLILEDCTSLVEIDESIGMAEGLLLLNLKDCKLLQKLPYNFCRLKLLDTLIISGCTNLGMLPADMTKMDMLRVFHADGLNFSNSSYTIKENASWRELIWGWISKQKTGPQLSLTSLPCGSITKLSLANCNLHENDFPKDFCVFPSLEYLDLSKNPIRFLPDCFKGLKMVNTLYFRECNQLETLINLPTIGFLVTLRCPLLEKITFQPGMSGEIFVIPWYCNKLFEMDTLFKIVPIGDIDSELINNCGIHDVESIKATHIRLYNNYTLVETRCPIQGVYENEHRRKGFRGKLFNTFYPGSSVPVWYTSQCYAPSISFVVSHSKLKYLNTCVIYKLTLAREKSFYMVISNRTKNKMIIYSPSCYGIPEGDEYMTWLTHWKFGSHELECGDEVSISISTKIYNDSFEVKEVGVHLVYQEEEEDAGIGSPNRLKVRQTCDETSQHIIPMEENPEEHHGTTQIYFLGSIGHKTDLSVSILFGEYAGGDPEYLNLPRLTA